MVVADTNRSGTMMTNLPSLLTIMCVGHRCHNNQPAVSCCQDTTHCSTCKIHNQLSSTSPHMPDSYQSSPSRHDHILSPALPKWVGLHTNFSCNTIYQWYPVRHHFVVTCLRHFAFYIFSIHWPHPLLDQLHPSNLWVDKYKLTCSGEKNICKS